MGGHAVLPLPSQHCAPLRALLLPRPHRALFVRRPQPASLDATACPLWFIVSRHCCLDCISTAVVPTANLSICTCIQAEARSRSSLPLMSLPALVVWRGPDCCQGSHAASAMGTHASSVADAWLQGCLYYIHLIHELLRCRCLSTLCSSTMSTRALRCHIQPTRLCLSIARHRCSPFAWGRSLHNTCTGARWCQHAAPR